VARCRSFPYCRAEGLPSRHGFCKAHADALDKVRLALGGKREEKLKRSTPKQSSKQHSGRASPQT
jgi:hypothetical protein